MFSVQLIQEICAIPFHQGITDYNQVFEKSLSKSLRMLVRDKRYLLNLVFSYTNLVIIFFSLTLFTCILKNEGFNREGRHPLYQHHRVFQEKCDSYLVNSFLYLTGYLLPSPTDCYCAPYRHTVNISLKAVFQICQENN